jgi:hypothetical protein
VSPPAAEVLVEMEAADWLESESSLGWLWTSTLIWFVVDSGTTVPGARRIGLPESGEANGVGLVSESCGLVGIEDGPPLPVLPGDLRFLIMERRESALDIFCNCLACCLLLNTKSGFSCRLFCEDSMESMLDS